MDCKRAERQLAFLTDLDLDRGLDASLVRHVDSCPECRVSLELVRGLIQSNRWIPQTGHEPDWGSFAEGVKRRLIAEACKGTRPEGWSVRSVTAWLFRPAFGLGMAAAAVLLALTLGIGYLDGQRETPMETRRPVPLQVSATSSLNPVPYLQFASEDQVLVPLETLPSNQLVFLSNELLSRLTTEEQLEYMSEDLFQRTGFTAPEQHFAPIEARLAELSPAELRRVAYALEHMIPN